jgi:phenylpropionate dioxygenase-like ring-hydroxylating dioxygenase large terminal subunit
MNASLADQIKKSFEYERNRSGPPESFPRLSDVPARRYTDPKFFELEEEYIWKRSWLCVGHAGEMPEAGSYRLCEETGSPILIVHGKDGRFRAFYNTCRHRGGPVVREPCGKAAMLRCQYHSWTYDLKGDLVSVPDERDFVDLDKRERALVPVRCEMWGGWIFINEDPDAEPLLDFLAPLPADWDDLDVDRLRFVDRHTLMLDCNWKVAVDAFLEVYHLKHIHPKTVSKLLDHEGTAIALHPRGHSRMASPVRPENLATYGGGNGRPQIESAGEIPRISNLAYSVFPNLVVPLDVTGFPFLIFFPVDIRRTRFEVLWQGPDWGQPELDDAWKAMLHVFDVVLDEDTQNLAWIQKSLESEGARGIPLNYQERRIYHLHEEIDRRIGTEKIPAELRVEPKLDAWVER